MRSVIEFSPDEDACIRKALVSFIKRVCAGEASDVERFIFPQLLEVALTNKELQFDNVQNLGRN